MRLHFTLLLATLPLGCGDNLFVSGESADTAEDAALALERGDEDAAIKILEEALTDDPDNANYLSLLAAAYAQRAGVEPLNFAQNMATSGGDTESGGEGGDLVALFGIMPPATEDSLADIDEAVAILSGIPADQMMPGDPFKIAIYQTASMVLHMKILDVNGDGVLSLEEITDLSDLSASGLLAQLAGAQGTLAANGADNETMTTAADTLAKYQTQIDAAPGATQEEKLKNYLAQSQAAALRACCRPAPRSPPTP